MNAKNQWFQIEVKLTDAGASKARCDAISHPGSDKALDGFNSLLAKKHANQAASPSEFQTRTFKVRGDDVSRVMGEIPKIMQVPWAMIQTINISEAA